MTKVVRPKGKIGPREHALRNMREGKDLDIPDFLKRTETPAQAAAREKKHANPETSAGVSLAAPLPAPKTTEVVVGDNKKPATQESDMRNGKKLGKKAAAGKARTAVAKTVSSKPVRPGTKLEAIVSLLRRPKGCTTKDVLQATGWPAVSMPAQAKAAGLRLRKEKIEGVTHYYAA